MPSLRSIAQRAPYLCALALVPLATGCSDTTAAVSPASLVSVTGNWQFSSTAGTSALLPAISGALKGSGTAITGTLHAVKVTACTTPATLIQVTGQTAASGVLTLTGALAGGTLTITGTLAADGRSLAATTYSVQGGACALAASVASAQSYAPITGTYNGTFSDGNGYSIAITSNLTQTPTPDNSGNYELSGTAVLPANGCFTSPASVANSLVSGGSFMLTYADAATGNAITVSGQFSPDSRTLTASAFNLSGPCGPDTFTGTLIRQ